MKRECTSERAGFLVRLLQRYLRFIQHLRPRAEVPALDVRELVMTAGKWASSTPSYGEQACERASERWSRRKVRVPLVGYPLSLQIAIPSLPFNGPSTSIDSYFLRQVAAAAEIGVTAFRCTMSESRRIGLGIAPPTRPM